MRFQEAASRVGYDRKTLASLLHVSMSTVGNWCRGGPIPQIRRASLARVFGAEKAAEILRDQGATRGPGRPPEEDSDRKRAAVCRVADIARRRGREDLARDIEGL